MCVTAISIGVKHGSLKGSHKGNIEQMSFAIEADCIGLFCVERAYIDFIELG